MNHKNHMDLLNFKKSQTKKNRIKFCGHKHFEKLTFK